MVAIYLYRGNINRVPDGPRQWPMPPRALTLEQFRILTQKRDQSLSRLAAQRNPNRSKKKEEEAGEVKDRSDSDTQPIKEEDELKATDENCEMIDANSEEDSNENAMNVDAVKRSDVEMIEAKMANTNTNMSASNDDDAVKGPEMRMNDAKTEVSNTLDTNKKRRIVELEKKVEVLKQKKHRLVQVLKQILNTEEKVKRRNTQSAALRASIPPQTEAAVYVASATRHVPRLSVEVNFNGDLGAELDPTVSYSAHGRQMHYMHSTSPSVASLTRPFQQNTLVPTPKSAVAAAGPSCFTPPASSPSPAAPGGASSSAFRGSRLSSP